MVCALFGAGLYGTGASWVYVSIHQYGQASVLLATLLTALFAISLGALFALPIFLYAGIHLRNRWDHNPIRSSLVFAAIWVLGEWFRGWFLTGFPWLYLGYGFIDTWLAGWAPLGGVLFISGIVAFSGALLGHTLLIWHRHQQLRAMRMITLLLSTLWLGGHFLQEKTWTQAAATTPLTVALVQPNNPVLTKWGQNTLPTILADIREKTLTLGDHDLIVWPESAIPALQGSVQNWLTELDDLASPQQTALIAGIPNRSDKGEYFNSVIGLGLATGSYQKRHLVPFGEYVPLESLLRGAIAFFDLPMSSFSSGPDQQTLIKIGPYKVASAICYEIAYSAPIAADARHANLLLTISNDTWFGDSLGPHQHLQIARFRALETGKPLLRATNDGITAIIDEHGGVIVKLPRLVADVLSGHIMPRRGATPYSNWGELPVVYACLLIFLWALGLSRLLKKPS